VVLCQLRTWAFWHDISISRSKGADCGSFDKVRCHGEELKKNERYGEEESNRMKKRNAVANFHEWIAAV
jgi:hypothetical protein